VTLQRYSCKNGGRRISAMGWAIGRYVIMPDHGHFFCRAELSAKPLRMFMQNWKQWTSKRIGRDIVVAGIDDPGLKESRTLWQEEFFDHVLRSSEATARNGNMLKRIQSVLDW
jgi:putative transposase